MAEIIIISNKPTLRKMIFSGQYKNITHGDQNEILEDNDKIRALCTFNEQGNLEYIHDYLSYDAYKFAENLRVKLNVNWIDSLDLMEYNQLAMAQNILFEEFVTRVARATENLDFENINETEAGRLWPKLTNQQKARVLPRGYIKNYLLTMLNKHDGKFDLLEFLHHSLRGNLSFGVLTS
jgi:hypothetical protein